MDNFLEDLNRAAGENRTREWEPMGLHTTFRVGGPARYFVSPAGEDALRKTILLCRSAGKPYYILGNGSNLLVSDKGYDGVMIRLGEEFSEIERLGENGLKAGAGALLSRAAGEALKLSLTGLEFAAGIPGSVGGAVVMNAGAYGGEMKDIIESVCVMTRDGRLCTLQAEELELGYRRSCIPGNEYVLLSARLTLAAGDAEEIRARMDELAAKRKEKQPLEYPSAGSTFKRPQGHFAGKLIEAAGLRGFSVGGAQVSEKHCGFVINRAQATAEDIRVLCQKVQERVKEQSGVLLETEIKMLGF